MSRPEYRIFCTSSKAHNNFLTVQNTLIPYGQRVLAFYFKCLMTCTVTLTLCPRSRNVWLHAVKSHVHHRPSGQSDAMVKGPLLVYASVTRPKFPHTFNVSRWFWQAAVTMITVHCWFKKRAAKRGTSRLWDNILPMLIDEEAPSYSNIKTALVEMAPSLKDVSENYTNFAGSSTATTVSSMSNYPHTLEGFIHWVPRILKKERVWLPRIPSWCRKCRPTFFCLLS